MRIEDVTPNLSSIAFEFFYCFSRFEFALKENHYLRSEVPGENAEPSWEKFWRKFENQYTPSTEARRLLANPPKRQIIGTEVTLDWRQVGLSDCRSDLAKVVRLVCTVRNNLFHGGKCGDTGWDDPERTEQLLLDSKEILSQFAYMASIDADYTRHY